MDISTNYGFFLPSRDTDDIADINQISDNFRIIDGKMVEKVEGKGLSENDYTAQDKEKVQGALQRNQGIENAGKFMSVDENGNIVPSIAVKESFGTVTVKSAANDVKLSGRRAEDDSANINADDCRIRNLADPIFDKDAVNKKYLDTILEKKFSEFVNVSEVGQ